MKDQDSVLKAQSPFWIHKIYLSFSRSAGASGYFAGTISSQ